MSMPGWRRVTSCSPIRRTAPSSPMPIWKNANSRVELWGRAAIAAPCRRKPPAGSCPRTRKVRILATLGPASDSPEMIRRLRRGGRRRLPHQYEPWRPCRSCQARSPRSARSRRSSDRPTTILADLQGPKLRVGKFTGDKAELKAGQAFVFDRDKALGDATRAILPHREIFAAARTGHAAAGRRRQAGLRVIAADADRIEATVEVGGTISNNKGRQRPRRGAAARGADRQGPRRSRLRARAGRRLDRALASCSGPRTSPRRGG